MTSNFDVVMDWNHSVNYALSVSHLAAQLSADMPFLGGAEAEKSGITFPNTSGLMTIDLTWRATVFSLVNVNLPASTR